MSGEIKVTGATQPVKRVSLEAVVIRKNGTTEDLGEIASTDTRLQRALRKITRRS